MNNYMQCLLRVCHFPFPSLAQPVFDGPAEELLTIELNTPLVIDCRVAAYPVAQPTLTKDGESLVLNSESKYTISQAQVRHAGLYTCMATNEHGTMSRRISVQVGGVPSEVRNIEVTSTRDGGVMVEWQPANSNGVMITEYIVKISYDEVEIDRAVDSTVTMVVVTRQELQEVPDTGAELDISVTITAVNGLGQGNAVMETTPVKIEAISEEDEGSVLCSLPHTHLIILLIAVCIFIL